MNPSRDIIELPADWCYDDYQGDWYIQIGFSDEVEMPAEWTDNCIRISRKDCQTHDGPFVDMPAKGIIEIDGSYLPRHVQEDRVTLYVGPQSFRLDVPKFILTESSTFFSIAFGGSGQRKFLEAESGQMDLTEEDPRDLLTTLRLAMGQPFPWRDRNPLHYPFPCEQFDEAHPGCGCWLRYNDGPPAPNQIPPMFRVCALIDRLDFKVSVDYLLKECQIGPGSQHRIVSPTVVEWALENCLPGGILQKYTLAVLRYSAKSGYTTLDIYREPLMKRPDIMFDLMDDIFYIERKPNLKKQAEWGWDVEKAIWKDRESNKS